MSKNNHPNKLSRSSAAMRREQELCVAALESSRYDTMTDAEWVAFCEEIAREASEAAHDMSQDSDV